MAYEFKNGDRVRWQSQPDDIYFIGLDPESGGEFAVVKDAGKHNRPYRLPVLCLKPYKEPVKVSGWVVVSPEGSFGASGYSFIFDSKELAEYQNGGKRGILIYVSGTEGVEP